MSTMKSTRDLLKGSRKTRKVPSANSGKSHTDPRVSEINSKIEDAQTHLKSLKHKKKLLIKSIQEEKKELGISNFKRTNQKKKGS